MAKRRARRASDSARAGADDWNWSADSEPSETFESPRPQERVLPVPPRAYEPDSIGSAPGLPAVWRPATPPPLIIDAKPPRRKPQVSGAEAVTVRSVPRPSVQATHLANFRPVMEATKTPCKQREDRRKVIFASGVGGRRRSAPGPYRRTLLSNYGCK